MKRKLLLSGAALLLALAATVQPSRAILYVCDNYCPSGVPTARCQCSGSSPYHPFGMTTCQTWVDYCWHGYPPG